MNKKILLIIILVVLFLGCIEKTQSKEQKNGNITLLEEQPIGNGINTIRVFHDDYRNVTCWVAGVNNGGGISCIPDSQLKT